MALHYITKHILEKVKNNYPNNEAVIIESLDGFDSEDTTLISIEEEGSEDYIAFATKIENFANNGYEYLFETNIGFEDNDGNCLEIFLLKPEYKELYDKQMDVGNLVTNKSWSLHNANFLIENPNSYITIWAGPL